MSSKYDFVEVDDDDDDALLRTQGGDTQGSQYGYSDYTIPSLHATTTQTSLSVTNQSTLNTQDEDENDDDDDDNDDNDDEFFALIFDLIL